MKLKDPQPSWQPSQFGSPLQSHFYRDVFLVLVAAWLPRVLFMLLMPASIRSFDVQAAEAIGTVMQQGGNPYHETGLLNWPPFWMQFIFVLTKISTALSVPFFRVLQVFLILVESGVIIVMAKLIREVLPDARFTALLIFGIALNPTAILLTSLHCHFDVMVAFWMLLFVLYLLRYNRTGNPEEWLCACFFLGIGILSKTVPLILFPMLAGGFRQVTTTFRFLGLVLLAGPAALGMSVIYVLSPMDVATKVIGYRSIPGYFGITGLFHIAGMDWMAGFSNFIFYLMLFAMLVIASLLFWSIRRIGDRETVLCAALMLAWVPVFGPGYATEYLYWYLPFLVITYAFFEGTWRLILSVFAVIAAGTYLVNCAFVGGEGGFLPNLYTSHALPRPEWVLKVSIFCETKTGQTLVNLPLFLIYLVMIYMGARMLLQGIKRAVEKLKPASAE